MRSAGIVLLLALAACSKQEPPPPAKAVDAQPAPPAAAPASAVKPAATAPAPAAAAAAPLDAAAKEALLQQGEGIFKKTCATCHMADGYGVPNLQPPIVGSGWISAEDPQPLLSLILRGSAILGEAAAAYDNDMAPQSHLTDDEVAAVASFVRQKFGKPPVTKPVTPAEVAVARSRPGLP